MFNSPAGGSSGELFPSPSKGHIDDGLSGEQSSDAQTLIDTALSGYYPKGDVNNLLAGPTFCFLTSWQTLQVSSLLLEKEALHKAK